MDDESSLAALLNTRTSGGRFIPHWVHSPYSIGASLAAPTPWGDVALKLYFVRHATASSKTTWSGDDGLRPLTATGRSKFRTAARALVEAGAISPELVVTSPLVRARQTAEILCKVLPADVALVDDDRLGGDFEMSDLRDILAEHGDVGSLAIVGHNPSFTDVLSAVTGGTSVNVRKGAIALVDLDDLDAPSGRLLWLAPPELFGPGG